MQKIKLTKEQFTIFQQGNRIKGNGDEYLSFPYWIKPIGNDEYELYSTAQLPIQKSYKTSGLLSNKYIIRKGDGSDMDPEAFYFVLRVDADPHAQKAAIEYALDVANENQRLAEELLDKVFSYQPNEKKTFGEWYNFYQKDIAQYADLPEMSTYALDTLWKTEMYLKEFKQYYNKEA